MKTLFSDVLLLVFLSANGSVPLGVSASAAPTSALNIASKAGPVVDGLQLSIKTEKEKYFTGELVLLRLTITNTTGNEHWVIENNPETDFAVDVTNTAGNAVSLTEWGKGLPKPPYPAAVSVFSRPFLKGHDVTHTLVLNRRYDLSKAGSYLITVKRFGFPRSDDHSKRFQLTSNVLPLVITEPPAEVVRPEDISSRP